MKKTIVISLLALHLFNIAGYSIVFQFLMHHSDHIIAEKIDAGNIQSSELFELKVPLHLPYSTNSTFYEPAIGDVEIEGVHYSYVKKRVSSDTLYILCLQNTRKTRLKNAKTSYSAQVAEPSQHGNKQAAHSVKKSISETEYFSRLTTFDFSFPGLLDTSIPATQSSTLWGGHLRAPFAPPDFIA
ncbi:MAG TPA: hypothetical protein VLC28_01590 [Flavitalea sp.]|nr:hypothetical protein [Flavitalea sp.]